MRKNFEGSGSYGILLIFFFIFSYIELSLSYHGAILFPNIGCFFVAMYAISTNRSSPSLYVLWYIVAICVTAFIGAILMSLTDDYFLKRMMSLIQLTASLFTGLGAFILAKKAGRRAVSRIFMGIFVLIVAGSILEIVGVIRDLSDQFRLLIYDETSVYTDEIRDITRYGGIRPSFFSREPSLVGVNAGLSMSVWLLTGEFRSELRRIAWLIASSGIALAVARSPTVIFFLLLTGAGFIFFPVSGRRDPFKKKFVSIVVFVFCLMLFPLVELVNELSEGGLAGISSGGSFLLRIIGPPQLAFEVLRDSPLFGVGIGAYDAMKSAIITVYSGTDYWVSSKLYLADNLRHLVSNSFWEYWIFFGLSGVLIALLVWRVLLLIGVDPLFPFLAMTLSNQNFGGIATSRPWFFFFLFAAITSFYEVKTVRKDAGAAKDRLDGARFRRFRVGMAANRYSVR